MNKSTRTSPNLRLRPGNGLLVRHEDLVLLCEARDGARSILDEVRAAASADQPGRHLVRQLVKTLAASAGRFPSLCAFGAVDGGMAVAVHGKARLRVTTTDGELRLDGEDAVTIVDRVVAEPVTSITGEIGDQIPGFCPWSELTAGVVRADALQYGRFAEPAPHPEDGSQVAGASCAKGHFNDPTNQYCASCGIGLTQAGRRPAQRARPPLGVLVLDDGTLLPVTRDHVIGAAPETASEAGTGDVTLVRLEDPQVCGVHARVRPEGWEVGLIDAGSANGTFLREPDAHQWLRVPSGGRVVLRPGAIVAVGRRQFRYDSYRRQ